jgi:PBSX family phage portal protein
MDQIESYEYRAKIDNAEKPLKKNKDPFSIEGEELKKFGGLSPNFKRRMTRMVKSWGEGQDGTGTKQLIPEMSMVSAYGLFDVVIPPYNLDEFASFYESSFANHAAVDAKVANIVGLGYHFDLSMRTMERLEQAESEEQLMRAHRKLDRQKNELIDWLESTNDDETFTHILEKVWTDFESVGNGYLEIGRKVTGEIGYIGHIPATTIRVRRLKDGFVQIVNQYAVFFRNFQDTTTPNPIGGDTRPNEIIHFKNYTPRNSYYGVPDVLSAATAVIGDQLAGRYNIDYFENKAVPRYIVTLKGAKLSIDSEDKLFRFLQSGLRGQNHRTLYIPLPGDSPENKVEFKMEPIENGVQEGSFEKYRRSNKDDILMAHQTPISKVGGGQGISIAAALAQDRTFKEQVARPAQRMLEKILNKIISEKTDMFKFKLNELTLTDEQTQSQIDERYLKTQVIVPNEVRTRMGLPMRDGGQEPIILSAQQRAEAAAQIRGSRERDTQRDNNASDSPGTASGRNPGGSGRAAQ